MGRRGKKGLETRVGRECSISRGGPDCTVEEYMSEESEEGLTMIGRSFRGQHSQKNEGECPR